VLLSVSVPAHQCRQHAVVSRHHSDARGQIGIALCMTAVIAYYACWCRCGMYEVDIVRTPTDIGMMVVLRCFALPAALYVGVSSKCKLCRKYPTAVHMH
jgi:hypothetical protein